MRWVLIVAGSCLPFLTVVLGTFVPLDQGDHVEYLFAAPPAATLMSAWAACVVALLALFVVVRRLARGQSDEIAREARAGRWLAPLAAIGAIALGVLPAVPGVGDRASVAGFFLYDLRWWWVAILALLVLWRVDALVGRPSSRLARRLAGWSPAARLLWLDAALFVGVVLGAHSTTAIRFDNALHGDEPKYVRYCEVWYQGHGLDISRLALVRDQPVDVRPALWQNVVLLARAVRDDTRRVVQDLGAFAADPLGFRWNRALGGQGGFLEGIHGGVYEVHLPGASALICSGYFVDRALLNVNASRDGKWPANLTMTNLMMLLIYGIASVVLFRLLRNALGSDALAWLWAAFAMLTLPTSAFAFQLYPEMPALLVVLAVTNALFFGDRSRVWPAVLTGLGAGALAWLHVRFLLVCLVLIVTVLFTRTGKARWAFLMAFGLVAASPLALNYHVTGSWWPAALWEATGRKELEFGRGFVLSFVGYFLDTRWGLFPHAMLLLLALPGLFVLARESIGRAVFVAAIVFTLVATSAGHTLIAGGTTPGRLIVAVVPLLFWPAAVLVRRFWSSVTVRSAVVLLGVLSLNASLTYNWHHFKSYGPLRDFTTSGWAPNLAFPVVRGGTWDTSTANFVLFLCWVLLIAGLSCVAFLRSSGPEAALPPLARRAPLVTAGMVGIFIVGLTAASAAIGNRTTSEYRLDDAPARAAAVQALVAADRCVCFSSAGARVEWTAHPNSASGALIGVDRDGERARIHVVIEGDGEAPAFGRVSIDFGDGEAMPWTGIVNERVVPHTYPGPGTYPLKVWVRLPDQISPRLLSATVEIHD
jgi:hypothetical protein